MIVITVRYFDGCPNWYELERRVRMLAAGHEGVEVRRERVDTPEQAQRLAFVGSPTLLIDGHDPFAAGDEPVGLACRMYETPAGPSGMPTEPQLRAALDPVLVAARPIGD